MDETTIPADEAKEEKKKKEGCLFVESPSSSATEGMSGRMWVVVSGGFIAFYQLWNKCDSNSQSDSLEGDNSSTSRQLKDIKPLLGVRLVVIDRPTGVFSLSLRPSPYVCRSTNKIAVISGGVISSHKTLQETPEVKEGELPDNISVTSTGLPTNTNLSEADELKRREAATTIGSYRMRCILKEEDLMDTNFSELQRMETELNDWTLVIGNNATDYTTNHGSSCPERDNVSVRALIDGKEYFALAAKAIDFAKKDILITDWSLNPELYLDRENDAITGSTDHRLDILMKRKADLGVKVYVLLWSESAAYNGAVNATWTKNVLQYESQSGGGGFIKVLVHTPGMLWSHHQKTLIIDQRIAFVGGLDLCFGRWDDASHPLADESHLRPRWPGKDFYNPRFIEFCELDKPYVDLIDRTKYPRMPWHDVQMGMVGGYAPRDVCWNFVQRWNFTLKVLGLYDLNSAFAPDLEIDAEGDQGYVDLLMQPLSSYDVLTNQEVLKVKVDEKSRLRPKVNNCKVQILRSIGPQAGSNVLEQSIHTRYLDLISNSQKFVYIENQFFITSLPGLENKIGDVLFDRISRAIVNKETYRVIVVLPISPSGDWKSNTVKLLLYWQVQTIVRHQQSLLKRLQEAFPGVEMEEYISFFGLVNHGQVGQNTFLEQVYVHSKLMIVDDRVVVCGSANINDRSMTGERDTEIAVAITDQEGLEGEMNGVPFRVARFVHRLRIKLWAEHLGLPFDERNEDDPTAIMLRDPVHQSVYVDIWLATAKYNRDLCAPIMNINADEIHRGVTQTNGLKKVIQSIHTKGGISMGLVDKPVILGESGQFIIIETAEAILSGSKGHLVPFPLEHKFDTELLSVETMMPNVIFQ